MQFTVPVQADVYDLEFSWQSLTAHPVSIYNSHIFRIYTEGNFGAHVGNFLLVCGEEESRFRSIKALEFLTFVINRSLRQA